MYRSHVNELLPLLLEPNNFAPEERTPWGGNKLVRGTKAGLARGSAAAAGAGSVGEAWELSLGPELPSRLLEGGAPLANAIRTSPLEWLGAEARLGRAGTALMVKLIDTREPLSLQVHPPDSYEGLGPDESGKEECWYVLDCRPGSGVMLGFRPGVTRARVARCLAAGRDPSHMLQFVHVAPGDFLMVAPGTPHAIGEDLTLAEVQHVLPGHRGVTYRYWDWGRRYDEDGKPSTGGESRTLHVESSLAVTAWDTHVNPERARARMGRVNRHAQPAIQWLCGTGTARVASTRLRVGIVAGHGSLPLPAANVLRALTVFDGRIELLSRPRCSVPCGYTAVLPASLGPLTARLHGAHAMLSAVLIPHPDRSEQPAKA